MISPLPYDLALKLKEVGWPQPEKHWMEPGGSDGLYVRLDENHAWAYSPNLEELIEACGDRFLSLSRERPEDVGYDPEMRWQARSTHVAVRFDVAPKIAIAHLWLKLQEKK